MRKKTIVATLTAIIMAFVFFIVNGIYGNPISAYIATQANVNYINEKYPEFKLEVSKANYHAKFSEYVSLAKSTTLPDLHFEVRYKDGETKYDYYDSDVLTGYNTEKRFGQERTNEIKPLLTAKYGNKLEERCFVEFDEQFGIIFKEGKVKINQPYYKEFNCKTMMFADFSMETVTPHSVATHIIELNSFLIARGYLIDEYIGDYLDSKNQGYRVSISKDIINSDLGDLIEKTFSNPDNVSYDKLAIYTLPIAH